MAKKHGLGSHAQHRAVLLTQSENCVGRVVSDSRNRYKKRCVLLPQPRALGGRHRTSFSGKAVGIGSAAKYSQLSGCKKASDLKCHVSARLATAKLLDVACGAGEVTVAKGELATHHQREFACVRFRRDQILDGLEDLGGAI